MAVFVGIDCIWEFVCPFVVCEISHTGFACGYVSWAATSVSGACEHDHEAVPRCTPVMAQCTAAAVFVAAAVATCGRARLILLHLRIRS